MPDIKPIGKPAWLQAIIRHAKQCPPPYCVIDILDRIANDRPISAGMERWLEGVTIEDEDYATK